MTYVGKRTELEIIVVGEIFLSYTEPRFKRYRYTQCSFGASCVIDLLIN